MANKSFVMYDSWTEMVEDLTDEEAGRLLKAIYAYRQDRTHKPDDRSLRPVFNILKQRFEEDDEAYQEKVAKRAEASRKANGIKRKQSESNGVNRSQSESNGANRNQMETDTDTEFDTDTDTDTVTDTESDKEIKKKPSRAAFVKPTLEEIKAYCKERKNNVDPEAFMDFYASKGWKVGSQPMKDWKAAVRTWEKREKPKEKPPDQQWSQRTYDYDALEKQLLGYGS